MKGASRYTLLTGDGSDTVTLQDGREATGKISTAETTRKRERIRLRVEVP